jgi:hypothetical protein
MDPELSLSFSSEPISRHTHEPDESGLNTHDIFLEDSFQYCPSTYALVSEVVSCLFPLGFQAELTYVCLISPMRAFNTQTYYDLSLYDAKYHLFIWRKYELKVLKIGVMREVI